MTTSPLNVQKPAPWSHAAWWKPEHGAQVTRWQARAALAAESMAPEVNGSERATSARRLPKPLSRRPARTSRTYEGAWTRARSPSVTGSGRATTMGSPRSRNRATTAAGLAALGE